MKSIGWLAVGLLVALAPVVAVEAADEPKVKVLGESPAYSELGGLAVMHAGRAKPLDTLAREEVKLIFGRETLKLINDENKVIETWGPTAALFDWSIRPSFWDDQPFILVQYLPLKRLILADAIGARLKATAEKSTTSAADRAAIEKLLADKALTGKTLEDFAKNSALAAEDRAGIALLAAKLSEEHKWLTPRELEEARVTPEGEQSVPIGVWLREIHQKKSAFEQSASGDNAPSALEENAADVGIRLMHYQVYRDRNVRAESMVVLPRPCNKTYLAFTGALVKKERDGGGGAPLTPLEESAGHALATYWDVVPNDLRIDPGTDEKADAAFTAWLKARSAWIPLKVILDSKPEELTAAGFDADKMAAFRTAFKDLETAEESTPGNAAEAKTKGVVESARVLGAALNDESYPTVADINVETCVNRTRPFWMARIA